MTDKEKLEDLEKKYTEIHVLFVSEKEMNTSLHQHIENLTYQLQTQSKILEKFCRTIGELRFKLKNLISDKLL